MQLQLMAVYRGKMAQARVPEVGLNEWTNRPVQYHPFDKSNSQLAALFGPGLALTYSIGIMPLPYHMCFCVTWYTKYGSLRCGMRDN